MTIDALVSALRSSSGTLVFSGAGISTLSGIPDFRGKGGLYTQSWHGMDPQKLFDIDFFRAHSELFYQYMQPLFYRDVPYEPNVVHRVCAKLQKQGLVRRIYTQNIDDLHQKAGAQNVGEFHGNMNVHHCLDCGMPFSADEITAWLRDKVPVRCSYCSGVVKPDIVFFGEMLDEALLDKAYLDFARADLVLVLGTSLTVPPSANFPFLAQRHGAKIAVINRDPTPIDASAAFNFDDLQTVFEALDAAF